MRTKIFSKKVLAVFLTMALLLCAVPFQFLTLANETPADVIIVDDEAGEILGLTTLTEEQAKVGSKSLVSGTNDTAIAYAGFWGADSLATVKDIETLTANGTQGALRFWFYVEDIDSLDPMKELLAEKKYSFVKIGSGNGPDTDMYQWGYWLDQVTKSGWNEVVLKFADAWKQGTPDFSEIDTVYFKFADNTPAVTVYIDDIRVSANTEKAIDESATSVDLPIYLTSGGATTKAKTLTKNGFSVDASKVENPYLKIEIYVAKGSDATASVNDFLTNSLIELNSSGTIDSNEKQWRWESGLRLEPGWNIRYLPLSQAKETGTFDISSIKGFRYYQNVNDTSVAFELKVKNLSIVSHTDVPEYNLDIDKSLTGKTGLQNMAKEYNKTNTHGYVEGVGSFDISNLKNPMLKLSVYIARDDNPNSIAGMLQAGKYQVELSSSGTLDKSEINWLWGNYDIKAGWNTIVLPFSEGNYNDGSTGRIDISKINYFRIYQLPSDTTVAYTFKVKDVTIIDAACEHETTKEVVTTPATYFTTGLKTTVCDDCGETVSTNAIPRDTADAITFTPSYEGSTLTIEWEYSEALSLDIINAIEAGITPTYNITCAIGGKNISNLPTFDATEIGGKIAIDGFNTVRLNQNVSLDLAFNFGSAYDAALVAELNDSDITKYNVIAKEVANNSADNAELSALIEAIGEREAVEIQGNNTECDDFSVAYSKVDIANATAEFKFIAKESFVTAVKTNSKYNDGRIVKLVVNIGGKDYSVTLNGLKTNITVKISGLSFSQMYGDITAKLVITYAAEDVNPITTQEINISFDDAIADSNDSAAIALEALMTE